eukprot:4448857-Prymnesium_polylepis.1
MRSVCTLYTGCGRGCLYLHWEEGLGPYTCIALECKYTCVVCEEAKIVLGVRRGWCVISITAWHPFCRTSAACGRQLGLAASIHEAPM